MTDNSNSRQERLHRDDPHLGGRSNFRRDRDSILYTNYFRRLAGVTQVVHVAEGHIFHNRLVHSLKVAQIGRSIADILLRNPDKKTIASAGHIDPDVVETACLAHDLGHPPFGHIAESVLDECARGEGIADGFEGNPQSFRIVTDVAIHDGPSPGLNLTSACLNALLKYPWERPATEKDDNGKGRKEYKKWGYFAGDRASFDLARQRDKDSGKKSVEAEIMDWADDITYSIHDVDDFYRAGIVPLDRILSGGREATRFLDWMKGKEGWQDAQVEAAAEFLRSLKPSEDSDLLIPFQGTTAQYRALRNWETKHIKRFLGLENDATALRLTPDAASRLHIPDKLKEEVNILKGLMRCYVYEAPALFGQQHGQRKLIKDLFNILFEAVDSSKAGRRDAAILPKPFDERLEKINKGLGAQAAATARVRLVTDIIASLTEQQTMSYYARLSGSSFGFLADRIFGD